MSPTDDPNQPRNSGADSSSKPKKTKRELTPTLVFLIAIAAALLILVFYVRQMPVKAPVKPTDIPAKGEYELYPNQELDLRARAVDSVLLDMLHKGKTESTSLKIEGVEYRRHEGVDYHFQTLRLPLPKAERPRLLALLKELLSEKMPEARVEDTGKNEWLISLGSIPTHRLLLPQTAEKATTPTPPRVGPAKMSIVIDDMGEDVHFAQGLAKLGVPAAFSIWPDSTNRDAVHKIAKASGNIIMIHLPMQPKGYPTVNPGKNPLLVTMTAEQIRETINTAVKKLPGATGVNNHMGSQFTEFATGSRVALTAFKEHNLFFLDSKTTPVSALPPEARKLDIRIYERDVFLDNDQSVAAILSQLRKAEDIARAKGQAIAIGHPHAETLQALQQWLKHKDGTVQVVPVTSLSRH
jgi:hypothetical protein